jgi:transcriptional regulator with GAF, ATPase, and Fis domain
LIAFVVMGRSKQDRPRKGEKRMSPSYKKLLLIGFDENRRGLLHGRLSVEDLGLHWVPDVAAARNELQTNRYDVVVTLRSPFGSEAAGSFDLPLHDLSRQAKVISCDSARVTNAEGVENLCNSIFEAISVSGPDTAEAIDEPWRKFLVGNHPSMQAVIEMIRLVARRRATVLISGETGTGKELVARAIHCASDRSRLPMVGVNCAALPEHLLEAELFGHTKGAFTGAAQQRTGRFEQANQGTIFLDELGELPLELQAKILRVLQEREIQRLGSSETVRLDIRVVAASNTDLAEAVRQRKFRQDLYYRLNVVPLRVPALRERLSDLPLLVDHFLEKICRHEQLAPKSITSDALDLLFGYHWPGNVRELEHLVEKAIALSGDRRILRASDFTLTAEPADEIDFAESLAGISSESFDFDSLMQRIERALLDKALKRTGGNKARAAEMLGMKRTTLVSKLQRADSVPAEIRPS